MIDWTINKLTSAVTGITSSISLLPQSTQPFVIETSNGTVNVSALTGTQIFINKNTSPAITPKRPGSGQVFPRGVYNK